MKSRKFSGLISLKWVVRLRRLPVADFVIVEVAEGVKSLAHDEGSLGLCEVLALRDEEKELAALAEPAWLLTRDTYSVTRKQMRSVSHVSCSLMMFG